jgi:predicted  nucleic acid-binding Zn-ribbon protein
MKTEDYINTLIKEKESLTALCKSHVETIRLLKREISKLNHDILIKDKKIQNLESEIKTPNEKTQKTSNKIKNELNNLKAEYKDLQNKYNILLVENEEYKRIFEDVENECDSD